MYLRYIPHAGLAVLWALALAGGVIAQEDPADAKSATDLERVVDVTKLGKSVDDSMAPFQDRVMGGTEALRAKYAVVREMLAARDRDPKEVAPAIEGLITEYDKFLLGWDKEVVGPIVAAEEEVADAIDRSRRMLAGTPTGTAAGKSSKETMERISRHRDRQIENFKREKDPVRRQRLALTIRHQEALLETLRRVESWKTTPHRREALGKLLKGLADLETRVTSTAYALETAGITMAAQRDMMKGWAISFRDLADAADIAKIVAKLGGTLDPDTGIPRSAASLIQTGDALLPDLDAAFADLLKELDSALPDGGTDSLSAGTLDPKLARELEDAAKGAPLAR